ncbi:putative TIM-barrel fold metal-dependent hydrolase [Ilumatobacter fluminis]|uniref:Putative TIM-barrel fold metal-dependent hydrolase n=1 Tax=Ilumatobacter fluminis TaxID=467091 RepID=A0A4R7I3N1_9ACTN|nr:amidohydrolase family protein [Ilumatobacter fluminis]TDT18252.1 putative TIM-barrel fold metal-dependent hydrolase [Ilumatobacter fluminis]
MSTASAALEHVHADGSRDPNRVRTFLPEPDVTSLGLTIVSADDHVLEPPDLFTSRLPSKLADAAPHVVEGADGGEYWIIDGQPNPIRDWNVASGRATSDWGGEPARYDELRRGAYDVDARVADMDLAGISMSLNFPSALWGFAGRVFSAMPDPELGLACLRAYNDWMIDDWCGAHPGRFIACQLPWLTDVDIAAAEIRRNAERGSTCVAFSENPEKLGLPSIHSGYWEPFFAACAETGTVINLHVGSSSEIAQPSSDSPHSVANALFGMNSMLATTDWLFSQATIRHPDLRIVLSESGIGWVPGLIDRLDWVDRYRDSITLRDDWDFANGSPSDELRRTFWYTSIWDPATFAVIDRIGADRVMIEVDYPHPDSSWPHVQQTVSDQLDGLPDETVENVTHRTAAHVYRCDPQPCR